MRFFKVMIMVISMMGSTKAWTAVGNFGELIQQTSKDEMSLHEKILQRTPGSEVAQGYHRFWKKTQKSEKTRASDISVKLVTTSH